MAIVVIEALWQFQSFNYLKSTLTLEVFSESPMLERLGLSSEQWLTLTTEFEKHFCYAAGAELMMNAFKAHTGHQRLKRA